MARETRPTPQTNPEDEQKAGDTSQSGKEAAEKSAERSGDMQDGYQLLKQHHEELRELCGEIAKSSQKNDVTDDLETLSQVWRHHAALHAALFGAVRARPADDKPANGKDSVDGDDIIAAAIETDLVSILLAEEDDETAAARLKLATRLITDMTGREEKADSGLLARIRAAGVEPAALARRIDACLKAPPEGRADKPHLLCLNLDMEEKMARMRNMPERDDQGRFMSDDGPRGGDRDRSQAYRRRDDDDDRRYSARDRGHGGWFGDREGHSEASRRGWDERRDERGPGRAAGRHDDDDRRYSARGRDDDDDRRYSARDRGQGGWFGDPEGHAEASRRGWDHRRDDDDNGRGRGRAYSRYDDDDRRYSSRSPDDDYGRDRGHGGWFGDAEGHSEASRRGWDHRRDDDDEYRRGRSRSASRYDDDDRRYSARDRDDDRGRGHGGWFGDPEGHSEASRRGWDHRR